MLRHTVVHTVRGGGTTIYRLELLKNQGILGFLNSSLSVNSPVIHTQIVIIY